MTQFHSSFFLLLFWCVGHSILLFMLLNGKFPTRLFARILCNYIYMSCRWHSFHRRYLVFILTSVAYASDIKINLTTICAIKPTRTPNGVTQNRYEFLHVSLNCISLNWFSNTNFLRHCIAEQIKYTRSRGGCYKWFIEFEYWFELFLYFCYSEHTSPLTVLLIRYRKMSKHAIDN